VDVGEAVGDGGGEAEDFGHFPEGGARAVGDDVGGHGGTARAVFFEDVLNDELAAVAGGKVDVDVGPRAAVFGKEALEEQAAADGVDVGNAEGVADGGVGGGAAALAEDAVAFGEVHDVVDDEEVALEAEFLNEGEFVFELGFDLGAEGAVAEVGTVVGVAAELGGLFGERKGVVGGVVGVGEAVAEVFEGEFEALAEALGVFEGFGEVGEEFAHLAGGLEVAFAVGGEEGSGLVEGGVVAEAGEGVAEEAVGAGGVQRGVAGDEGKGKMAGELDELAVEAGVVAEVVAGELDVEVFGAELLDEGAGEGFGGMLFSLEEEAGELVVAVAGEGDDRSSVEVPSDQ